MVRVPPGEWVPHVEAYVDVARPAAQHVPLSFLSSPLPLSPVAALVQLACAFSNSACSIRNMRLIFRLPEETFGSCARDLIEHLQF